VGDVDALFIDGIVNGAADLVRAAGERVRKFQGGVVGGYAFSLLAGASPRRVHPLPERGPMTGVALLDQHLLSVLIALR